MDKKNEHRSLLFSNVRSYKYVFVIFGIVVGFLLVILGGRSDSTAKNSSSAADRDIALMNEYAAEVEKEVGRLCSEVYGVYGNIVVTVTLESGYEVIYATEKESKAASGSQSMSDKYATVGSGSSEKAIPAKTLTPTISGIGVVCGGGGNAGIRAELISLISATFGIGVNKIFITEGKG